MHVAPGCSTQPQIFPGVKVGGRACSCYCATRPGMCLHAYACRAKGQTVRADARSVQCAIKVEKRDFNISLHASKPTDDINWSHHGVSHVLLAVIRTLLAPVLVLELMEFVFPLLLLQLLLMTLLLNLPLVLQKLLLVLECQ